MLMCAVLLPFLFPDTAGAATIRSQVESCSMSPLQLLFRHNARKDDNVYPSATMFTDAAETLPPCDGWWQFGLGLAPIHLAMLVSSFGIIKLLVLYRKYVPQASENLMNTQSLTTEDDPERNEDVLVVLSCYNETQEELEHSISTLQRSEEGPSARLMVFVDGLQRIDQEAIISWFNKVRTVTDVENPSPKHDKESSNIANIAEDVEILSALTSILPSGKVELDHGCVCIRGIKDATVPYPFEIYVKGPGCPRSKRASQALCMSILQADHDAGRANPGALLLLDGDCRVEPDHVGKMFECMQEQNLAACGPFLLTKKYHNFCLLVQLMRDWFSQRLLWLGQSAIRFQLPLNGSCAMYAMETVRAVQKDFCRGVQEDSMLDSMMIEMGEDSFMTNLVHEKYQTGGGIRFLPHCWATSFMPETWNEYLAQQCRWKRSHMGNRVSVLFNKPDAWLWKPSRWIFWPIYVASFLWTPFLAPATLTLWFSFLAGRVLERFFELEDMTCSAFPWVSFGAPARQSIPALIHGLLWIVLTFYAFASAGCSVAQRRWLHTAGTAFFMLLGASQLAVLLVGYGAWKNPLFWGSTLGLCLLMMAAQVPHGLRRMWAGLLIFVVPLTTFIENLQQPIVAVANADGLGAKWGTRGKASKGKQVRRCCFGSSKGDSEEESQQHYAREIRLWSRRVLLPTWLAANYGLGEWVFSMDYVDTVAIVLSLMMAGFMLFHLCLGLLYSFWLAINVRRRASGSQMCLA